MVKVKKMDKVYSVKEITAKIKGLLESGFGTITVEGEISNFRPSSTGHFYFTLKDEKAAISAVMFKGRSRFLGFVPKDGMTVQVSGALSVYEQRGAYQIVVDKMTLAGEGDILRLLEERKQRLAQEGLFDSARKKSIPAFPEKIAVITSPTGAAVRDIINVASRRNAKITVTVLPAAVQGEGAAETLTKQLKIADTHALGDVIILGRGGGSLEDLLPFSDEGLVRAVAACKTPVISAVGHEIDWALSDYAADLRAPTPSAAAELAVPLLEDTIFALDGHKQDMLSAIEDKIERIKIMLHSFKPEALELRFRSIQQPLLLRFDDAKEEILNGMKDRLKDFRHRLDILTRTIEGADPQGILNRGYSIVRNKETGKTVRSFEEVSSGVLLTVRPAKGSFEARVEKPAR